MEIILKKSKFQSKLIRWFEKNQRDLPWRKTKAPYAIWASEIMLQQTQVPTVIPYYQNFLKTFPTIHHLAKAHLSKVLKVWEGLGYYARARNLHHASKIVVNRFHGRPPDNLRDLLSLPGIGRSTAGSILSFAYNKEAPVLDGNVKRVLSRLFAVSISRGKAEKKLWEISESLIPKGQSNLFNQALMDLGSMICTPRDPQCPRCPIKKYCKGTDSGNPEKYSMTGPRKTIPHAEAITAVIQRDGRVLLNPRPPQGLLGGLWEFPNWKLGEKTRLRLRLRDEIRQELGMDVEVKNFMGTFTQTYSHFKLTLQVFNCQYLNGKPKEKWIPIKKLDQLPMSKIHRKIANII